jgi:hypothetical protein
MNAKEKLTKNCVKLILGIIRVRGRLTMISNESVINRSMLRVDTFQQLHFYQLVRLLFATADWMSRDRFVIVGARLFGMIWDVKAKQES